MKYCKRIDWDFVICNQVLYLLAKQSTISQRFTKVVAFKSLLGDLLKITGAKICLKDQKLRYSIKMINDSATGKEQTQSFKLELKTFAHLNPPSGFNKSRISIDVPVVLFSEFSCRESAIVFLRHARR